MISVEPKNSNFKSLQLLKTNIAMTSRSTHGEETRQSNGIRVSPWSGDEYYNKLKKQIKNDNLKKKSQIALYDRFFQDDVEHERGRVKTVNLQMSPVATQQLKIQWNKIMPKKTSTKVLFRELNLIEKLQAQDKIQKSMTKKHSQVTIIHNRKASLKYFPQAKPKKPRLQTDYDYHNMKKLEESRREMGKGDFARNSLFYFQTKNKSKYSHRERMVMKIRNLERGRVDKALTNQY